MADGVVWLDIATVSFFSFVITIHLKKYNYDLYHLAVAFDFTLIHCFFQYHTKCSHMYTCMHTVEPEAYIISITLT